MTMKCWTEWYIRVHHEKEKDMETNIYYLCIWGTVLECLNL